MGPNEAYAREHRGLPPLFLERLAPFFAFDLLACVQVYVLPESWLDVAQSVGFSGHGAMTLWNTITCYSGMLDDQDGAWNILTPRGAGNWAHEVRHVQQWHEHPGVVLWQYVKGLATSWRHGGFYLHQYFPYEQEAIAYGDYVRRTLATPSP